MNNTIRLLKKDPPINTTKSNFFYVKRDDIKLSSKNFHGVNVAVSSPDNFLNLFGDIPPPDVLIIEYDYNMKIKDYRSQYMEKIVNFKGKIYPNVDMHYFIASKRYYIDILSDYVIPGTVIVNISDLCQNKLALEPMTNYIFKLPFTSANRGISKSKGKNIVSLCKKLGNLARGSHTGKIIIQPFLSNINEFKFFVINGDIFYPSVLINQHFKPLRFDSDDYAKYGFTEAQKISVESLVSVVFNEIKAKYDQLIYLRIDVIYDVLTKKFYLNEIEPFASGKYPSLIGNDNINKLITKFIKNIPPTKAYTRAPTTFYSPWKTISLDDPNYMLRIKLLNSIPEELIVDAYKQNTETFNRLLDIYTNEDNLDYGKTYYNLGLYANGRQLPTWLYRRYDFISGLIDQKKNNLIWIYEKQMRKANVGLLIEVTLLSNIKNMFGWINVEDYKKFYNRVGKPTIKDLINKPPGWEFLKGSIPLNTILELETAFKSGVSITYIVENIPPQLIDKQYFRSFLLRNGTKNDIEVATEILKQFIEDFNN